MESTILQEKRGHVLYLTLNRPAKLNCINWRMLSELEEAVSSAEDDPELRLLVLKGAGDRAFSTGGDLNEFQNLSSSEAVRWIRTGQRVFDKIESLPSCSIAVIDGYAYGGGLELAIACDLRIATPRARIASPEIKLGWAPGWGALNRLSRIVGEARAKELVLLCEPIQAEEALRIGLVNRLIEIEDLEGFLNAQAEKLAQIDPSLLAFTKSALSPTAGTSTFSRSTDVLATLLAKGSAS